MSLMLFDTFLLLLQRAPPCFVVTDVLAADDSSLKSLSEVEVLMAFK